MSEQQYQCPICETPFGSKGSVKAHITRKTDDAHKGMSGPDFSDEISPVSVGGSTSGNHENDGGGSSGGSAVTFPSNESVEESEPVDNCCENPALEGSGGDAYRLDSGAIVRLESGDQICLNCEEIHD